MGALVQLLPHHLRLRPAKGGSAPSLPCPGLPDRPAFRRITSLCLRSGPQSGSPLDQAHPLRGGRDFYARAFSTAGHPTAKSGITTQLSGPLLRRDLHPLGQCCYGLQLRSIGSPRLLRSYGSLRPCASPRYAHPRGSATWSSPLSSRRQVPTFRPRAWLRVTPPLCRVSSRRAAVSPWTGPGLTTRPGFDTVPTLSTRSRWFTSVRLSEPYLTRSRRAVSGHAHHPGSLPKQLPVVWSLPCQPAPRGHPSSLGQQGCIESTALLHPGLLSAPSWRTVIREAYDHNLPVRPRPPPRLDPQVEHVVQVDVRQQR